MSKQRAAARRASPKRPSPGLIRGIYIAWLGVVLGVIACTLIGLQWNFQRNLGGLPTPVIVMRPAPTQPATPQATAPALAASPALISTPEQTAAGVSAGPNATPPTSPGGSFGYGIEARLNVRPTATLDQAQQLGLNWIKYPVDWSKLEPEPGQYQWDEPDRVMAAISEHNLALLLTISNAPGWARSVTAKGKNGPPDNVQAYVKIVSAILQRYRNAINAIEIWNEENIDESWYAPGGLNPTSYLNLLIPASQAIRQMAPGVIIISGALTPTGKNDGISAVDDFAYMQALIDGKLLDHVDCVGVHHIGFNLPPTLSAEDAFSGGMPPGTYFTGPYDTSNPVNPHHSWSFYSTINGYHNMIVATGRETPLCVTAFGWASAEGIATPQPEFLFARDISPDQQAKYIVRAFRVMHDWGFVRLAILYNLDYAAKPVSDESAGAALFSILQPDGLPRPAYDALRDMPKLP